MTRERIVFLAASVRFLLAALGLLLLPLMSPELSAYHVVFGLYVVVAAMFQLMIWRGFGGRARTIASGVFDAAFITFFVHLVGSVGSATVALYAFAAMVNTAIAGRRTGLVIAGVGIAMYTSLLVCESVGLLPFAPAGASWIHGRPHALELLGSGTLAIAMTLFGTLAIGALVTHDERRAQELVEANLKLEELTRHDALTGLFNRRYVMQRLEEELARFRRGHALAVIMVDLDHFKRINDELGHLRGDELLRNVSTALLRAVRTTDVVGRYGGDEFVVVLPDTLAPAARVVAERVVLAVREVGRAFDERRSVTASAGLGVAVKADDARKLLDRADEALYAAKSHDGDRVSLAPEALASPSATA